MQHVIEILDTPFIHGFFDDSRSKISNLYAVYNLKMVMFNVIIKFNLLKMVSSWNLYYVANVYTRYHRKQYFA